VISGRRLLLILLACAGLAYLALRNLPPAGILPPVPSGPSKPLVAPSAAVPHAEQSLNERTWAIKDLRALVGEEIELRQLPDGRLVSARGKPGAGRRAGTAFRPEDPRQATARAKEILAAAGPLLGLSAEHPLEEPTVRGTEVSAQVFFRETAAGVPVAPAGTVSIDLGPQGELLGLHSEYVPEVRVRNEVRLGADEARSRAVGAVADQSSGLRAEGGSRVVWIVGNALAGAADGRHAYEFTVQGRQVVVDAATGAVLYQRDRRRY
jgi:hypothetical protein